MSFPHTLESSFLQTNWSWSTCESKLAIRLCMYPFGYDIIKPLSHISPGVITIYNHDGAGLYETPLYHIRSSLATLWQYIFLSYNIFKFFWFFQEFHPLLSQLKCLRVESSLYPDIGTLTAPDDYRLLKEDVHWTNHLINKIRNKAKQITLNPNVFGWRMNREKNAMGLQQFQC